jgi:hypothetical protein
LPESRHRRRPGGRTAGRGATDAALSIRPKKKKTNYLLLGAFLVIALLVIGSFGLTTIPLTGGGLRVGKSDKYVEGVGVSQELMPTANHLGEDRTVKYTTTPPTSGDHWAQWANCGFYPEGLPDERVVHNLEHSNIVISYNLTAPEDIESLRKAVEAVGLSRAWGVTRYYDKLAPGTVALAAWGILDTMPGVDRNRIKKFFETYAGKIGPEKDQRGIGIPC